MKKFLMALVISLSMIGNVEAAELYDVIHREVSYFNPNDRESAWIAQAILYASSEYQVDPILITAVMEAESSFDFKSKLKEWRDIQFVCKRKPSFITTNH